MNRRKFLVAAGGATLAAGATGAGLYTLSDTGNLVRADLGPGDGGGGPLEADERAILSLAALAPSGHNAQPWSVRRLAPYHWVVGNDPTRWLPAVDPEQRETVLSIGAFLQNLESAAGTLGYSCSWTLLAKTNQDGRVVEVKLTPGGGSVSFDGDAIRSRRTVRSHYLGDALADADLAALVAGESEFVHYLPAASKESGALNELTVEANRLQSARDPAQQELADWVRFSSRDAAERRDGLTTAGMEMGGVTAWAVRNFYGKGSVLTPDFRRRGLDGVAAQVARSAGWLLVTGRGDSVADLLDAGRRAERLFLRARPRGVALHPMTQVLEEPATRAEFARSPGVAGVQFLLRVGYVKDYPPPVSLRRPVGWFVVT